MSNDGVKKAAAAGSASAQYAVGVGYLHGTYGETDISKHLKFLMLAAINGNRTAREVLAGYHRHGTHNFPVNYDLAEFWYRKAREQGSMEAERQLAKRKEWGIDPKTSWTDEETLAMGVFALFALFALGIMSAVLDDGTYQLVEQADWHKNMERKFQDNLRVHCNGLS